MATATAAIFPWREAYSVGIPEIDNQHKVLIKLINKLHSSMLDGKGNEALASILDELVRYTETHFAYELSMLRQRGYSGLAAHTKEHKRLTGQLLDLLTNFKGGKLTATIGVMQFLKGWLANHILERDLAYARELKTQ